MSQQRHTIRLIEKESGLADLILRPLSAQHFAPTLPEREGIVDRDKLLNISGRGRKEQFALAEHLGVTDYPCPAGGCLLTDKVIAATVMFCGVLILYLDVTFAIALAMVAATLLGMSIALYATREKTA